HHGLRFDQPRPAHVARRGRPRRRRTPLLPAPGLRAGAGGDRHAARADLPPHARRRRVPQLFLEGEARLMSIRDAVAVVGVGCSKFGEHYDRSAEDLVVEAAFEAYADAGIEPARIEAASVGTLES